MGVIPARTKILLIEIGQRHPFTNRKASFDNEVSVLAATPDREQYSAAEWIKARVAIPMRKLRGGEEGPPRAHV